MSALDQVRILIFRCHQKGLEVLLINNEFEKEANIWHLPTGEIGQDVLRNSIQLEDQLDADGNAIKTIAIEADWHQIPSIRAVLKHDIKRLGKKIKANIPEELHSGAYHQIKQAIKHTLPQEYEVLKELKDVVLDRNLSKSI